MHLRFSKSMTASYADAALGDSRSSEIQRQVDGRTPLAEWGFLFDHCEGHEVMTGRTENEFDDVSDRDAEKPRTKSELRAFLDRRDGWPHPGGRKNLRKQPGAGYQSKLNAAIWGDTTDSPSTTVNSQKRKVRR